MSSLPCPPARNRDRRLILILDQRPILQGFKWRLLERPTLRVQELADEYADTCPTGYSVVFKGADVLRIAGRKVLVLGHGQVVSVEFVLDSPAPFSGESQPPPDGPPEHGPDSNDSWPDNDPVHSYPSAPADAQSGGGTHANARTRSRSPRQRGDGGTGASPATSLGLSPTTRLRPELQLSFADRVQRAGVTSGLDVMWSSVFSREVLAEGTRCLTPVSFQMPSLFERGPTMHRQHSGILHVSTNNGQDVPRLFCRLLPGSSGYSAFSDGAFANARTATLQLGLEWPLEPRPPLDLLQIEDDDDAVDVDPTHEVLTRTVFVLLAPEYRPEQLTIDLELPQTVQEALDVVETCRDRCGRDRFPGLLPVSPQPDVRWALAVMVPDWAHNLTLVDERIFAVASNPHTDRQSLLHLAGIASRALVDVYVPGFEEPIDPDTEIYLTSGDCVTFVRTGEQREYTSNLQDMLRTHLGWAPGPAFPPPSGDDRVCAVSDGWYCDVPIRQERVALLRADIAARFGISPLHLAMHPAATRPADVALYGRACCTVVGVGESYRRDPDRASPTALIDCRPILEGWRRVSVVDGWVDIAALRTSLMQGAPEGYRVAFSGCRHHWSWLLAEQGMIIIATFEPVPHDPLLEGSGDNSWTYEHSSPPPSRDPSGDWTQTDEASNEVAYEPSLGSSGTLPSWTHRALRDSACMWSRRILQLVFTFGILSVTSIVLLATCWVALWINFCALICRCVLARPPGPFFIFVVAWQVSVWPGTAMHISRSLVSPIGQSAGAVAHFPNSGEDDNCHASCIPVVAAHTIVATPRPVPTPARNCRSRDGIATSEICSESTAFARQDCAWHDTGPLVTLLEEATSSSDHWAFLAATLLDTLVEYYEQTPCRQVPCRSIKIAEHLPLTQYHDLTAVTVDFGSFFATAPQLVTPGSWSLAGDLPPGVANDAQVRHLCQRDRVAVECLTKVHLFTDGSFHEGLASWAFAAFQVDGDGPRLHGWASGQVTTQADDPWFVGARDHTPLIGEQTAILWAIIWALQSPPGISLMFFSDCQVALRQTTGRYGSQTRSGLATKCRHLFQALESAKSEFRADIFHVRSHQGTPENELVDRLAKWACHKDAQPLLLTDHLRLAKQWCLSSQLPWLWSAFAAIRCPETWPAFTGTHFTDADRDLEVSQPTSEQCRGFFGVPKAPAVTDTPACIWGSLCTFSLNTQTLEGNLPQNHPIASEDAHFLGKAAFLREQFECYGAHVVALQEARAPADAMFVSSTHVRLCTGRDKQGNFGVELWLSRLRPFAWVGQTALTFDPAYLLVLHCSPRELFVRFTRGSLRILFVSVHGPVHGSSGGRPLSRKSIGCAMAVILSSLEISTCILRPPFQAMLGIKYSLPSTPCLRLSITS